MRKKFPAGRPTFGQSQAELLSRSTVHGAVALLWKGVYFQMRNLGQCSCKRSIQGLQKPQVVSWCLIFLLGSLSPRESQTQKVFFLVVMFA